MDASWKFSNLPESAYKEAVKAYKASDIDALVSLHNKYNLSKNNYCCSVDEAMLNWWKHGIEKAFKDD